MQKKEFKNNALIKRGKLIEEIHKERMRINKKNLAYLSRLLQEDIKKIIKILARESMIKGKRTLTVEDIDAVFKKLEEKEEAWEI